MLKEVNLSQIVQLEVNKVGSKIFTNENLTARRKGIMAAAWKMKKNGQFESVWSMDGKIFVCKTKNTQAKHGRRSRRLNASHLKLSFKLPLQSFSAIFYNRFSVCISFLSAGFLT